jgi:hypothetical protein
MNEVTNPEQGSSLRLGSDAAGALQHPCAWLIGDGANSIARMVSIRPFSVKHNRSKYRALKLALLVL